jgi:hypothetical protein
MDPELHLGHLPIDVLVLHVSHFDCLLVLLRPGRSPCLFRQRDSSPLERQLGYSRTVAFFLLLIASLFGKTMHRICWGIIKLALVAGLIWYIYMIFKLA